MPFYGAFKGVIVDREGVSGQARGVGKDAFGEKWRFQPLCSNDGP